MDTQKLKDDFLGALIQFGKVLFYFLFLLPYELWLKATVRLNEQRKNGSLQIKNITSFWPFLTFLKRFIFDFLLDAIVFIIYVISLIPFIICTIQDGFAMGVAVLIACYYTPIGLSIVRDILTLLIKPFGKYVNWVSKPAQTLDLNIKNV